MYMIGWSLGLVLENVGGDGRSTGRLPVACEIAVCTSVAAASMLLLRRELQREAGVPLSALGSHQLQPVDLHELALERRGDVVGDRSRGSRRDNPPEPG